MHDPQRDSVRECYSYLGFARNAIYAVFAVKGSWSWMHNAKGGVILDEERSVVYFTGKNRK